ncbi:hypothetical protein D3C76_1232340 [compost metagenome]
MHAACFQHVNGASQWRGHRRDEDGVAAVLEHFNDESRDERIFNFDQGGLPYILPAISRHLLGQTTKQAVAGDFFKHPPFHPLAGAFAQTCTQSGANEKADQQNQNQR